MGRSSVKRVLGTLLFVLALIVTLAFGFLLFAESEDIDSVPGTGVIPEAAAGVAIFLGVVVLLLVLLLVVRRMDRAEEEAEDAEAFFIPEADERERTEDAAAAFDEAFQDRAPGTPDVVVYDVFRLPVARRSWADEGGRPSFYYPLSVEGGVYVNDYVDIAPGRRLKLRTLLAGPRDVRLPTPDYVIPREAGDAAGAWTGPAPVEEVESPGDDFMAELERRYRGMRDTGDYEGYEALNGHDRSEATAPEPELAEAPRPEAPEVYYDFGGDVHDVIDVEGIGPVYAQRLQQVGVHSTARLCYEDPDRLATALDVSPKTVRSWQSMAQLMKVSGIGPQYAEALARAGIEGIDELKRRSPARIADQVNKYLEGVGTNVLGQRVTERRVTAWQEAAKSMRRVRQKVPVQ